MNKIIIGKKGLEGRIWFKCHCGRDIVVMVSSLVISDLFRCPYCGKKFKIEFGAVAVK